MRYSSPVSTTEDKQAAAAGYQSINDVLSVCLCDVYSCSGWSDNKQSCTLVITEYHHCVLDIVIIQAMPSPFCLCTCILVTASPSFLSSFFNLSHLFYSIWPSKPPAECCSDYCPVTHEGIAQQWPPVNQPESLE